MNWYLVYAKPRGEQRAQANLEAQGLEVYLPQIERDKMLRGKKQKVEEALFPGYLFVRFDPSQFAVARVKNTRGVAGMVQFGAHMPVVPSAVVLSIMQQLDDLNEIPEVTNDFTAGDKVIVTEGPFAHLNAVFQESSGENRCFILLEMMGKQQRLEVEQAKLAKQGD
ncbi:transcription/translation regulatory transformer protein RfaH [Paraferrimonas sedimenticola]|nr:transcription/translation regulatory transformer protein RfaH [Paraferrimonas sedimenticola]